MSYVIIILRELRDHMVYMYIMGTTLKTRASKNLTGKLSGMTKVIRQINCRSFSITFIKQTLQISICVFKCNCILKRFVI